MIYHITTQMQWLQALQSGYYESLHFKSEGFIHASSSHQVENTANRIFKGKPDLILLCIDESILNSEIIYENLEGGAEQFPHIYGHLPVGAVTNTIELQPDANGFFQITV